MIDKPESGRYRTAVERGRTHDKIGAPDPAAAPLQTDAETGGHPTPRSALAAARNAQTSRTISDTPQATNAVAGRNQGQIPTRSHARWLGGTLIAMVLLGLGTAILTLP